MSFPDTQMATTRTTKKLTSQQMNLSCSMTPTGWRYQLQAIITLSTTQAAYSKLQARKELHPVKRKAIRITESIQRKLAIIFSETI